MNKFQSYIDSLNVVNSLSAQDYENTLTLLELYVPLVRQSMQRIDEYSETCFESRRQSVSDFINLAIDFEHDDDCRHITERLANTGHSMQLLEIMEKALNLVQDEPKFGPVYYKILKARYFECSCKSNEDAFLLADISRSTYYRHIKQAQKYYAAMLWCVVIPDMIIASKKRPTAPPQDQDLK